MPEDMEHRRILDERLRDLARLSRKMGRLSDAADAARERRAFWRDDPAVALRVAGELAAAAVPARADEPRLSLARDRERHRYAALALEALHDAARITAPRSDLGGARSRSPPQPFPGTLH